MFPTLRFYFVIFLVTLQLIAPLVHAHTNQTSSVGGVHVPGLEGYRNTLQHTQMLALDWHYVSADSGIIVGVDVGIKPAYVKLLADADLDSDSPYVLLHQTVVIKPTLSAFDVSFSPHSPPVISACYQSSHSPRAPPAVQ